MSNTSNASNTSVSARIATALAAHVEEAFGLMGNGNAHFVDALSRTPVRYTAVRHEVGTVASADAYFRVCRRPAIATTTYGAGFTNIMTALADARMSGSAMVVVVGDAPSTGHRPWDVDQEQLAQAVGVPTLTADVAAPAQIALDALRLAVEGRTPVVLAIPYDLAARAAGEEELDLTAPIARPATPVDAESLAQARDEFAAARRPVILAGRGARGAKEHLTALADATGALLVATAPARGIFAGHPRDLGVCGGFSSEGTARLLGQADVVLAVGAGLNQFTMGFGHLFAEGVRILQIDDAPAATHPAVTRFIRGDARDAVAQFAEVSHAETESAEPSEPTWPGLSTQDVAAARIGRDAGNPTADDGRLDPRSLMRELNALLPEDRLVVTDGGHFIGWPNTYLDLPSADSIVMVGTAYQSIGLGFSSAPGAAVAAPERTLVVVSGDGGGLMALADLDSTVRAASRAIIVIVNDAAYNAEITQYGTIGLDRAAMDIAEVNFAAFAEGVGATGHIIRRLDDLAVAREWIAEGRNGTLLLDCRVSPSVIAPYQREIMSNLRRNLGISEPVEG